MEDYVLVEQGRLSLTRKIPRRNAPRLRLQPYNPGRNTRRVGHDGAALVLTNGVQDGGKAYWLIMVTWSGRAWLPFK